MDELTVVVVFLFVALLVPYLKKLLGKTGTREDSAELVERVSIVPEGRKVVGVDVCSLPLRALNGLDRVLLPAQPPLVDEGLFAAVLDGHGNAICVDAARKALVDALCLTDGKVLVFHEGRVSSVAENPAAVLCELFSHTDSVCAQAAEQNTAFGGCTCTLLVVAEGFLCCANIGDSEALLISNRRTTLLTEKHLVTENVAEKKRLQKLDRDVVREVGGVARVAGRIAVSRAFGDFAYKKFIVNTPHVFFRKIRHSDQAVVLASDGFWNLVEKDNVVGTVRDALQKDTLSGLAKKLANQALGEKELEDDLTVVVVDLRELADFY